MAKNRYTKSRSIIANSRAELIAKIKILKRAGKPIFVALIKGPSNFKQELPIRQFFIATFFGRVIIEL